MANVIRCDRCGDVRPHRECFFVKCYQYENPDQGMYTDGMDLCGDCYRELMEELGAAAGAAEVDRPERAE